MQEYLETIYRLEEEGQVARTGEIAKHLHVAPPSVTDMLQKLEKDAQKYPISKARGRSVKYDEL